MIKPVKQTLISSKNMSGKAIILFGIILASLSSCVKEFPDDFPDQYNWKAAIAIPLGETTMGLKEENGYDSLLLAVDTLTGYSVWAETKQIEIKGSFSFHFYELIDELEGVESVVLRINIYNGFPVAFNLQAFMVNGKNETVNSMFPKELLVKRGTVSGGGKTEKPVLTSRDIIFRGEEIENLKAIEKISISAIIPTIQYFPEYSFKVQMGAILRYDSDVSLD